MSDECGCKTICSECYPKAYFSPTGELVPECRTCQEPAAYRGKLDADNEQGFLDWPVCDSHVPYMMIVGTLGEKFE